MRSKPEHISEAAHIVWFRKWVRLGILQDSRMTRLEGWVQEGLDLQVVKG